MPKRYLALPRRRPRADDGDYGAPFMPDLTVFERDRDPVPTGVLNHLGEEMHWVLEQPRIGFVHFEDSE